MTKITDKHHFFWKAKTPLSNWYKEQYTVVRDADPLLDGARYEVTYNCSEQPFMVAKALLFNDYKTAYKIMHCKDPSKQQKLGREIVGYDEEVWKANREELIYQVLIDKFTFGSQFVRDWLKSTKGLLCVEASPIDPIWGIGMAEEDEGVDDPANWKGLNTLGRLLTRVRIELYGE